MLLFVGRLDDSRHVARLFFKDPTNSLGLFQKFFNMQLGRDLYLYSG